MEVTVLTTGFSQKEAAKILTKRSKHFFIENMDDLFYPYLKIMFHVEMGQKLKKLGGRVMCLVDMYRDTYNIAKSLGKYETLDIDESKALPQRINIEESIKKAPSQIYGDVMAKQRVLRMPEFQYLEHEVIYKKFYIVECKNEDGEFFHILFDATMGEFSLLNA